MPLFNEAHGLPLLYQKLCAVANQEKAYDFRFIFVNDGSTDSSLPVLLSLHGSDSRIAVVDLSRNFGHHRAISAGLSYAQGDCAIVMDADLEDDPEHILRFLEKWQEGWEVVYAVRGERNVSWMKGLAFRLFHKINKKFSGIDVEEAGTFALMDRRIVRIINQLPERNRYIPGLRSWVGFRQTGIVLGRNPRYDAVSRVGTLALIRLAFDSFVGFSVVPLQLVNMAGLASALIGFLAMILIFVLKVFLGITIQPSGWASLVTIVLFMAGIQLICLGVIGEYISRMLEEVKARPLYLVRAVYGLPPSSDEAPPSRERP